ncbi:MAG: XdhC/CoxI family protein [Bacteroidota bacterium]
MNNIYLEIENILKLHRPSALCVIIETKGSTPRKAASKMIVFANNEIIGTVGGGAIEKQVIADALKVIEQNKPLKKAYQLEADLNMHCGGMMEVYIEPLLQTNNLYIFGAGHVGKALAKFAKDLNFQITFFDWREISFTDEEAADYHFIKDDYLEGIKKAVFDTNTFSVIVTPSHEFDEQILSVLGKKPAAYIGMIGSRRKVEGVKKNLLQSGLYSKEEIEGFDMPIGIPINVETPDEIAISILAKLIDVRNSKNKI